MQRKIFVCLMVTIFLINFVFSNDVCYKTENNKTFICFPDGEIKINNVLYSNYDCEETYKEYASKYCTFEDKVLKDETNIEKDVNRIVIKNVSKLDIDIINDGLSLVDRKYIVKINGKTIKNINKKINIECGFYSNCDFYITIYEKDPKCEYWCDRVIEIWKVPNIKDAYSKFKKIILNKINETEKFNFLNKSIVKTNKNEITYIDDHFILSKGPVKLEDSNIYVGANIDDKDKVILFIPLEQKRNSQILVYNGNFKILYDYMVHHKKYYTKLLTITPNFAVFVIKTKYNFSNSKDPKKYKEKPFFVVDGSNWKEVLMTVPVAVWTSKKDSSWCQKGYLTASNTCVYPIFVLDKDALYDDQEIIINSKIFNSTIFNKFVYIIPNLKDNKKSEIEISTLLAASPNKDVELIKPSQILNYWEKYSTIVYSEDSYETSLVATTYASLINSPLIIENTSLDCKEYLKDKYIICVGNVRNKQICDETYSVDEIRKKYLEKTKTNRYILINSKDINNKIDLNGNMSIYECNSILVNYKNKTFKYAPIKIVLDDFSDYIYVFITIENKIYLFNLNKTNFEKNFDNLIKNGLPVQILFFKSKKLIQPNEEFKIAYCKYIGKNNLEIKKTLNKYMLNKSDYSRIIKNIINYRYSGTSKEELFYKITKNLGKIEKSGIKLDSFYKMSLLSPILASAKQELLISTHQFQPERIKQDIYKYGNPKYLTIFASPLYIPDIIISNKTDYLSGTKTSVKSADLYYANYSVKNNSIYINFFVGRIYGFNTNDVSLYLIRDLFYNKIFDNKFTALLFFGHDFKLGEIYVPMAKKQLENYIYLKKHFNTSSVDVFDANLPLDKNLKYYKLLYYFDHGKNDYSGFISENNEIKTIDNKKVNLDGSIYISMACLTCSLSLSLYNTFDLNSTKNTFCINSLRNGAIAYYGGLTVLPKGGDKIYSEVFKNILDKETLGEAVTHNRYLLFNETMYDLFNLERFKYMDLTYLKNISPNRYIYDHSILLGDPLFKPYWKLNRKEPTYRSEKIKLNISKNHSYIIDFFNSIIKMNKLYDYPVISEQYVIDLFVEDVLDVLNIKNSKDLIDTKINKNEICKYLKENKPFYYVDCCLNSSEDCNDIFNNVANTLANKKIVKSIVDQGALKHYLNEFNITIYDFGRDIYIVKEKPSKTKKITLIYPSDCFDKYAKKIMIGNTIYCYKEYWWWI